VLIWHARLTTGGYNVVIDANRNGFYDATTDGLDSESPGFIVIASSPPMPPAAVPATTPHDIPLLIAFLALAGVAVYVKNGVTFFLLFLCLRSNPKPPEFHPIKLPDASAAVPSSDPEPVSIPESPSFTLHNRIVHACTWHVLKRIQLLLSDHVTDVSTDAGTRTTTTPLPPTIQPE
jgi:hypothetical protein